MAEEKAAAPESAPAAPSSGPKPILFIALAVVNMIVVGAVGWMLYKGHQQEAAQPTLKQVVAGEAETAEKEKGEEKSFVGKVVPLETFVVNMAGAKGRKVMRVNMELELQGEQLPEEIEKRKAQIRDIIIITLSSKTYEEISTREGKDNMRSEIKDTINNFLTKGKIKNVFFTDLIYN